MNKAVEQAKFVQEALRAGKKVAVAVPRLDLFERVAETMIPDDLKRERGSNDRHHIRFTNGARLWFVPTTSPGRDVRGIRYDLAYYYQTLLSESSRSEYEQAERVWGQLAEHAEMHELELP